MDENLERIDIETLTEDFDEIMERVENGQMYLITVDGEDKAVLIPYDDYNTLINEIDFLESQQDQ